MEIIIYLYNGVTALDAIGPYEVLSRLPGANVKFVARKKGTIVTDTRFLKLVAEFEIFEVQRADVLLIPGSSIGFARELQDQQLLAWIQKVHQTTQWTTAVCSGAIVLAAAGLLSGLKATTHWAAMHLLSPYNAIPVTERYIQEGKLITAQGVSAGIDMGLFLASRLAGDKIAKTLQLVLEYNPEPPFSSGDIGTAEKEVVEGARTLLDEAIQQELSLSSL